MMRRYGNVKGGGETMESAPNLHQACFLFTLPKRKTTYKVYVYIFYEGEARLCSDFAQSSHWKISSGQSKFVHKHHLLPAAWDG